MELGYMIPAAFCICFIITFLEFTAGGFLPIGLLQMSYEMFRFGHVEGVVVLIAPGMLVNVMS
jgi:hypothetical protein